MHFDACFLNPTCSRQRPVDCAAAPLTSAHAAPTTQGIRKWAAAVAASLLSLPHARPWLLPRQALAPMAAGNDELLSSVEDGAELAAWALDRCGGGGDERPRSDEIRSDHIVDDIPQSASRSLALSVITSPLPCGDRSPPRRDAPPGTPAARLQTAAVLQPPVTHNTPPAPTPPHRDAPPATPAARLQRLGLELATELCAYAGHLRGVMRARAYPARVDLAFTTRAEAGADGEELPTLTAVLQVGDWPFERCDCCAVAAS